MCKFYSAIVMKNGDLLHNQSLMSHEDIIDMFEINDIIIKVDDPDLLKIEEIMIKIKNIQNEN